MRCFNDISARNRENKARYSRLSFALLLHNTVLLVTSCYRNWNECWPDGLLGTLCRRLPPSELPFAEQVLVQNVSHENHLIFMRMTGQVAYIFILIVCTDLFCHRGKSKLRIGLFTHELLREPLIQYSYFLDVRSLSEANI